MHESLEYKSALNSKKKQNAQKHLKENKELLEHFFRIKRTYCDYFCLLSTNRTVIYFNLQQ